MQKGLNTQLPQIPFTWNRRGITLMLWNLLSIAFVGNRIYRLNIVIQTDPDDRHCIIRNDWNQTRRLPRALHQIARTRRH